MSTSLIQSKERPHTRLGWWAVWLMAAFAAMWLFNMTIFAAAPPSFADAQWRPMVMPFYAVVMLLCGLTSGILGVIAIARQQERSWLVWLTLLTGLFVLFFLLGEVLFPH